MATGTRGMKTEHSGAKNGGGYWGTRKEAKTASKKRRRRQGLRYLTQFSQRLPGGDR